MSSSDAVLALVVLATTSAGCLPEVPYPPGDRGRLGCPEGETCTSSEATLTFARAAAPPCGAANADLDRFGVPDGRVPGSTAVALGGLTGARLVSSGSSTRYSDHFVPDGAGLMRASRVGDGYFAAYTDAGLLIDYVSLPVATVAEVRLTDGRACPERPVALLLGHPTEVWPLLLDGDRRQLVDLGARVDGAASARLEPRTLDPVEVRVGWGVSSTLVALPVVEAIDAIEPLRTPVSRLRGRPTVRPGQPACFVALSGESVVLDATIRAVVADGSEVETDGCVTLGDGERSVRLRAGSVERSFVIHVVPY